ncbi:MULTISPECIES: sulfotransferase family 2 domain-containing protein [Marinobacter]|uniref:sulfotransferase family 2 domain-containing protein n=1 Tax=Marinobacter TaxID=2742 RepID=UPI000DABC6A2|nr:MULTISPECIES: sulfotransferase family 2 domain-containing protein [Marinobacter]
MNLTQKIKIQYKHLAKRRYHREIRCSYRNRKFEEYDTIFVHIPKAAGTAIHESLFGRVSGLGHASAEKYMKIYGLAAYNAKFKFTFVRNPYDRFVSAYQYLAAGGNNSYDRSFSERKMAGFNDFEDFVINGFDKDPEIRKFFHFRKQVDFITVGGQLCVDFVGRYENLEKDFKYIASFIGEGKDLRESNRTANRQPYQSFYDNEQVRRIVHDYYRDDFETLDYPESI